MAERITERILINACGGLNERVAKHDAFYNYRIYYGSGGCELQRTYLDERDHNAVSGVVRCGTKAQIYEFIYAMQTALDDIKVKMEV